MSLDPLVLWGVALLAILYVRGARTLGRLDPLRVASFFAGLAVVLVALVSPLDAMADQLFLAHMVQHLLLLMVAVPLLLLGAPAIPLARGLPRAMRAQLLRPFSPEGPLHPVVRVFANPLVSLGLYIGLLSLWHIPALYDAALEDRAIHALEHLTYLFIATLFWTQVIDPYPFRASLRYPVRIPYLFVATAHNTVLGGILSFAEPTLYSYYARLPERLFGISPIADQQWGGVIMWVPGGMVHLVAISFVFAAWLNSEDRSDLQSRPLPDHA